MRQPTEGVVVSFTDLEVRDSHRREVSDDLFDGGVVGDARQGLSSAVWGQGDVFPLSDMAV
jgi:hypothetical protein